MKILIIISLVIVCSACSSKHPGLDELKALCEKDAGLTIYKTVKADGYYDDTTQCHHCWHDLIGSPFEYIEFCDYESNSYPVIYIFKEHGCYRLSKVKRDSGQCHIGIDKDIEKSVIEPFTSFKEKQCIYVEKIDNPSLGVGLFLNKNEGLIIRDDFEISRYQYTIKNISNTNKYGEFINYSLVVKTVGGAGYSCGSSAVTGLHVSVKNPSFYKTIISKIIQ